VIRWRALARPAAEGAPTIRTVAARAGVSKSLVSLVLQGSPKVRPARRDAVLKAMEELGYQPDPSARSLAERRTRTVGVVIDDLSNPWYPDLLAGLRPVLHERALRPLLADGRTEPDAVNAMVGLRVEGLLVVGTPTDAVVEQVGAAAPNVPVVIAGTREPRLPGLAGVANDDETGARSAIEYLLELGHTRIAHVVGEGAVGDLRRTTFEAVMERAGLPSPSVQGDWTESTGHRLAGELLARDDRPTAIFAANDLSAVGVLAAADDHGLRVPDDLSVIGYDNTVFARMRRVSLTTVDPHITEVGRVAGELLLDSIDHPVPASEGRGVTRLVPPSLITRSTTAAPTA
jgi:DNA-binding LacI/PurR family transcriptional regulator